MNLNYFKKLNNNVSLKDDEFEFIKQSNYIEAEYGTKALSDAVHAWDYIRTHRRPNLQTVLQCHYILMVDIDSSIAGKIREQSVTIGGALKPFISSQLIRDDITYLCMRIVDGRVGRMLYNAHRLLLGEQIHIIKESEKGEYYDWF